MYLFYQPYVLIGVTPKAASTSIQAQLTNNGHNPAIAPEAAASLVTKNAWRLIKLLRDPIDRCESCYNYFQDGQTGNFPKGLRFSSITHFLDTILNGEKDDHWVPQMSLMTVPGQCVDLETFPITQHRNACKHKERIPDSYLDDLKIYYAADIAERGNQWE